MAHSHLLLLILPVLLTSSPSLQSMAEADDASELATLLTIKKDWGNPSALSSWSPQNTSSYCSSWEGLRCLNGTVVSALSFQGLNITNPVPASICNLKNLSYLDLSFNNLTGEFPSTALHGCSALQFLDLSNNHFSAALPDDIDKLSSAMEHLNLSSNAFTGIVPTAIAAFPKLRSLVLDTNRFSGTYPSSAIGKLTQLETLTLANNPFAPGPIPHDFGKLTKLQMLWMSGMNLTGRIPDKLSSLTELTTLALHVNKLHGEIPPWVWKLQKLELLNLFDNSFTGAIGPDITARSLRQIDLSTNRLTGHIPKSIGSLRNLSLLYLYFNNLTGTIPTSVGRLPNLADIRLFSNRLSGPLPPELGKHSPLGNLEVCNNLLSGELPDTLCSHKKLYDIVVFNNSFSGAFPANLGDCVTVNNLMAYNNYFTGEFPEKVWSAFPNLTTVMIQNNSFTGTMPRVISSTITRIEIGNNRFSGDVPTSAPGLKSLRAENNQFSGPLPENMSGLANLTELHLAWNRISGSIPPSIRSLGSLNYLNLSSNLISGAIPAEIGSLPALTILDLSSNELAGEIPQGFNNLHLSFLNLSSNQLTGELPKSLQSPAYEDSFLGNQGLCAATNLPIGIPACRYSKMPSGLTIFLASAVASVILVGAVGCFVVVVRWRKQRRRDLTSWKMMPFRKLDFSERDVLTNLREEDVIGGGGSGKVYRVHLGRRGRTVVAVKKLWSGRGKAEEKLEREFDTEVKFLGDIRHDNIVSLLCYISSDDDSTKLLVYEYMENGSLDRWLHGVHARRDPVLGGVAPLLNWRTRLAIAIDAARGLSYMHNDGAQPIMHRNVKSSNIILDGGFRAKVADFGVSRILFKSGGEPESVSGAGSIAPEEELAIQKKVDVYGFGVVLLELATGREENNLVEWAWRRYKAGGSLHDVVDERIQDRMLYVEDAVAVFQLGLMCTDDDPQCRPSMGQVMQRLIEQLRWPRYYHCKGGSDGSVKAVGPTAPPRGFLQISPL